MSSQTSDLLWSVGILVIGVIGVLTNYKNTYYKDPIGYRRNGVIMGVVAIIAGIYAICKVLFFTSY